MILYKESTLPVIRRFYRDAVDTNTITSRFLTIVKRELGMDPPQLMHADSICSDDVNNIEYPEVARQMLGPFNLGGLNGFPFTGLTGMGAFANHVPEDGAVFIFYGPHIGITKQGEFGYILRPGQSKLSTCCGAAHAALNKLKKGEIKKGEITELDYQQNQIEQIFFAEKERILDAANPLQEATEVMYEAIDRRIRELAQRTNYQRDVLFMGSILINSDYDAGSFACCRRLDIYDHESGATRNFLPEMRAWED